MSTGQSLVLPLAPTSERRITRIGLIVVTIALLVLLLLLPLLVVFVEALRRGVPTALAALVQPDAIAAILLSLLVAAISVPLNTVCGIAAAWSVSRFHFPGNRGKTLGDFRQEG